MTGLPPELTRFLGKQQKRSRWRRYLPVWGGAVLVGLIAGAAPSVWPETVSRLASVPAVAADVSAAEPTGKLLRFDFCHTGGGYNCVVDGDTFWLNGEKIRIADIDAPETHDFRCTSEKELGDRATRRLEELLESGPITLESIDRDEDRYGRKLRIVLVDGEGVGETLVDEGLVRWYGTGRRSWC